jgi:inosose dehydratase
MQIALHYYAMPVRGTMNRPVFSKAIVAGAGAAAWSILRGATRHLKIGYTCIAWGAFPRGAFKDVSALGFYSFETFPEILDDWDAGGSLRKLVDQYHPLKSGYCRTTLADASKPEGSVDQVIRLGKTIKKYGGTFVVIAPNSVQREGYSFKEYRANIIAGLNDYAMALALTSDWAPACTSTPAPASKLATKSTT